LGLKVEESHDGKKTRGHHRKSTSNIHGSDLVYLLSLGLLLCYITILTIIIRLKYYSIMHDLTLVS
jgi:hypothetical protein